MEGKTSQVGIRTGQRILFLYSFIISDKWFPYVLDGFLNLISLEVKVGSGKCLFWFLQCLGKKITRKVNASLSDNEDAELIDRFCI